MTTLSLLAGRTVYSHCIFQVFDLQYASPATVSRCGMVYVDPKNLGYLPFWQKWVNSRTAKVEKDNMQRLYDKYVPTLVDMVVEGIIDGRQGEKMKTIVPLTNLNMVGFLQSKPGLQIRVRTRKLFFLFLNQNICCGYSIEPSQ